MKNKLFLLNAIISSCILTTTCYADMGSSNIPSSPRSCYPASKCAGDPNSIGTNPGYSYSNDGAAGSKVLQSQSTENFVGTVKSVNRVNLPNEIQIQLVLTSDQGDLLVIVGPASFVDQAKVKLQAGDKVTVTGYRINANGQQVIMAAQIQKNGYSLQLLDDNRMPLWQSPTQLQSSGGSQYGQYSTQSYGSQSYSSQKSQSYGIQPYGSQQPSQSNTPYSGTQHPKMPTSQY